MIDVPHDTPQPGDGNRDGNGRFAPGNRLSPGRRHGQKGKLSRELHELVQGTIGRRGKKYRAILAKQGVDVEEMTDAECWIDSLDEDQLLKLLTHLLPKGVELSALDEDGEPVRPIIVMYGSKNFEAATAGRNGDDGDD